MIKKITFLTRHYPPNKNINGILVNEMVSYLEDNFSIQCSVVFIDSLADGNRKTITPRGILYPISPIGKKNTIFSRALSLFFDGYSLVKKANKLESDLVICTTSPPLLPFWLGQFLNKNKKWALWSFDLFPEGFMVSGKISDKNPIYKFLEKLSYTKQPDLLISLGKQQAEYIKSKYKKDIKTLLLPAGVLLKDRELDSIEIPNWKINNKRTIGYFGNLGDAHNPQFIMEAIKASEKLNYNFVLACYGVHADKVKLFASKFPNVFIAEKGLSFEELTYVDIHLVTLKSEWTHVAVPSKAVTSISLGIPILFCGNSASDNWQMFKDSAWFVDETKILEESYLFNILNSIDNQDYDEKKKNTKIINANLMQEVVNTYSEIPNLFS